MSSRLLVVQPDVLAPLDRWAEWLADGGVSVRLVRPFAGEKLPDALDDGDDGLVVLGGSMGVDDDRDHPWLGDVRRLLRQAVERSRPTLGICLGGQLLAQTLGGSVVPGDRGVEAGAVSIRWRPEAEADPLFAGLAAPFVTAAFHREMISGLPDSSVWLGRSDLYPHQAFRLGPCAWGIQFHPETSLASYRRWVAGSADSDPDDLVRLRRGVGEMECLEADISTANAALARRFADLLRTARTVPDHDLS
jgi:GMP synthase (glutamine-hydrolysing)